MKGFCKARFQLRRKRGSDDTAYVQRQPEVSCVRAQF